MLAQDYGALMKCVASRPGSLQGVAAAPRRAAAADRCGALQGGPGDPFPPHLEREAPGTRTDASADR